MNREEGKLVAELLAGIAAKIAGEIPPLGLEPGVASVVCGEFVVPAWQGDEPFRM
jgi:hypothetical protein